MKKLPEEQSHLWHYMFHKKKTHVFMCLIADTFLINNASIMLWGVLLKFVTCSDPFSELMQVIGL
jgi:hypothetical protein